MLELRFMSYGIDQVLLLARDISKIHRLEEMRRDFVANVSHELKTPLTSIQMYSQMLKEGTIISETHQQKYFEFIYSESERLTRLINNILQLSTLNHQQQGAQPEYTQLTILQDIIRSKISSMIDKNSFQQKEQGRDLVSNKVMPDPDVSLCLALFYEPSRADDFLQVLTGNRKFAKTAQFADFMRANELKTSDDLVYFLALDQSAQRDEFSSLFDRLVWVPNADEIKEVASDVLNRLEKEKKQILN